MTRTYAVHICAPDPTRGLVDPYPECPNAEAHTPRPDGYLDWVEWAEAKKKTHRQMRCDGCNRWAVWVPKKPAPPRRRG